jgi:hypothetical protein
MATLVNESFLESLQGRLEKTAAAHQRCVPEDTICLLEKALAVDAPVALERHGASYCGTRKLLEEFDAALRSGTFHGGTDSTRLISDERDAR